MESTWRLHHLAYVVRDLDRAIKFHESMGLELMAPPVKRSWGGPGVLVYGKPMEPPMEFVFCLLKKGKYIVELFQPLGEAYIWTEFLDQYGEGLQHIHFDVDDLEKEVALMKEKGFEVMFSIGMPGGKLREAFFDTRAVGKVIIALYHNVPDPRFPGYITPEASAKLREEMAE